MNHTPELIRHVALERDYCLVLWDTHEPTGTNIVGHTMLGYALIAPDSSVLFRGVDFRPAPHMAVDNDRTVRTILGFLTLRPGDTDAEYFSVYTPEQLAFATGGDAEALAAAYAEELAQYPPDDDAGAIVDLIHPDDDAAAESVMRGGRYVVA